MPILTVAGLLRNPVTCWGPGVGVATGQVLALSSSLLLAKGLFAHPTQPHALSA